MGYLKPSPKESLVTIKMRCDKHYNSSHPENIDGREWSYKALMKIMWENCNRVKDDKFIIEITVDLVDEYNRLATEYNSSQVPHHKSAQAIAKMFRARRVMLVNEYLLPYYGEELQDIIKNKGENQYV